MDRVETMASQATRPGRMRYSLFADNLPATGPLDRKFTLATEAGYEGLEVTAPRDMAQAAAIGDAAREAGLAIHTAIVNDDPAYYLSGANPAIGIAETLRTLQIAKMWGAGALLVLAANITAGDSYTQCYDRSQRVIRDEILPAAREFGITIVIENIREIGFLQSPLEFARYIDECDSPWVKALLDLGNVIHGHPEHWVRVLAHRIARLHVKDAHFATGSGRSVSADFRVLGRGDSDWAAIAAALADVNYTGWATNAFVYPLSVRALNKAIRLTPEAIRDRLPLVSQTLSGVEWAFARAWLGEGARRMRGYFES